MDVSTQLRQQAYSYWLRMGRWPTDRSSDDIELKFNPYHDPRNGQFTFAPGGQSLGHGAGIQRAVTARAATSAATPGGNGADQSSIPAGASVKPVVPNQSRPPVRSGSVGGGGSNSRAFQDAMTLEQTFPGLQTAPGGAILVVADNFFDLMGPANAAQVALLDGWSRKVMSEIKAVDPAWRYDRLGPVNSVQGRTKELSYLRFQRAAVLLKVKGATGPLQVETLRFVQQRADDSYEQGLALLEAGRLTPRLSDREALGNYVDARVRRALRIRYNQHDIDSAGKGPVRVNRRENDSSGTDLTYRRPDARVGDVAFDFTLTRKTLATAQVRGFFNTDFRPSRVPPATAWSGRHLWHFPPGDEAMNEDQLNPYSNLSPYIPASLSEINDQIAGMIFEAPTFIDRLGDFPDQNIDSDFHVLGEGFGVVRRKLGEERYAALLDLAARAKALFAADQDDSNGKTDEGRALLFQIEDVLQEVRRGRVKAELADDDGEITGD